MMMVNYIKNLEIKNYKSIKELNLDCSRINLFVGKPNVGKSNILEAVSLLGEPYGKKFFSEVINYVDITDLFYNRLTENAIEIRSDSSSVLLKKYKVSSYFGYINYCLDKFEDSDANDISKQDNLNSLANILINNVKSRINPAPGIDYFDVDKYIKIQSFGNSGEIVTDYSVNNNSKVRLDTKVYPYKFNTDANLKSEDDSHLLPPDGKNLFRILDSNEPLNEYLHATLAAYNLEPQYNVPRNEFSIIRKIKGRAYDTPYSLLADTIQRIIFYKAAIYSNENSVLIFEEPEVNSFPPYIQELANNIVDSKSNQFFISTHSPYLLTTILERAADETGLFIVDYKDNCTVAKKLDKDEISELFDYGTDIFLNIEDYSVND